MDRLHPADINFFTTYRCNSRCRNCGIWKTDQAPPGGRELDADLCQALFQDPLVRQCTGFGFAGGEPTISSFFWKMLEILPPDKNITITTNALSTQRLLSFLKKAPDPRRYLIQVSLDGIGEVNDHMRGVAGAFRKTEDFIKALAEIGVKRLVSFTMNSENLGELPAVYRLAEQYGALFSARVAYQGGAYVNQVETKDDRLNEGQLNRLEAELQRIVALELEKPDHYPAKLVFFSRMAEYHRGRRKDPPCLAMQTGMVIDLYGHVYPNCPAMMESVGNIGQEGLSAIWAGTKAAAMRERIRRLSCGGCWNDCQVVTNIACHRDFLSDEYAKLKIAAMTDKKGLYALDCNHDHHLYLLNGWHALEGEPGNRFRWTEPSFSFLIPPGTRGVEFCAMAPSGTGLSAENILSVGMESHPALLLPFPLGEWACRRLVLPEAAQTYTPVRCALSHSYCPQQAGHGSDSRKLGLAINRIRFLDR